MREDPGTYRPVSVISVPGKVTEIVLGVTERHVKKKATIRPCQHGFFKRKSCLNNLISGLICSLQLPEEGKGRGRSQSLLSSGCLGTAQS